MKTVNDINLESLIEEETGKHFKNKMMCCPFHNEKTPSFSVKFDSNKNKWIWKCFGACNESGDAIDFIKKYKGLGFIEAKKYLGLDTKKNEVENEIDKVNGYIQWQMKNPELRKNDKLLGIFPFVDKNNKVLYFKAKFLKPNGKKELSYYHINEDGKVKNTRIGKEVPYNYYNVTKALSENKDIVVVEGEKDVNTLRSRGYTATSLKGFAKNTDFDFEVFRDSKIIFCGDTGEAGDKYLEQVKGYLLEIVKEFKVVDLPGIEKLGDNADITDWLEEHTQKDLDNALKDTLDLKKNKIYKYVKKKTIKDKTIYEPLKIWENLNCLLKYKGIKINYNKLSKEIECDGIDNNYGENAILDDIYSLSIKNGLGLSTDLLSRSVQRIAKMNAYSPVQEYLLKCHNEWDGSKDNIEKLCNTIKQAYDFEEETKKLYIKKWLLNSVNIAFNNEGLHGIEGLLVFQGKQGIRKTTWIKELSPKQEWVKTGLVLNPADKDSVFLNTKYWFTELG
jgi:DNA primase